MQFRGQFRPRTVQTAVLRYGSPFVGIAAAAVLFLHIGGTVGFFIFWTCGAVAAVVLAIRRQRQRWRTRPRSSRSEEERWWWTQRRLVLPAGGMAAVIVVALGVWLGTGVFIVLWFASVLILVVTRVRGSRRIRARLQPAGELWGPPPWLSDEQSPFLRAQAGTVAVPGQPQTPGLLRAWPGGLEIASGAIRVAASRGDGSVAFVTSQRRDALGLRNREGWVLEFRSDGPLEPVVDLVRKAGFFVDDRYLRPPETLPTV